MTPATGRRGDGRRSQMEVEARRDDLFASLIETLPGQLDARTESQRHGKSVQTILGDFAAIAGGAYGSRVPLPGFVLRLIEGGITCSPAVPQVWPWLHSREAWLAQLAIARRAVEHILAHERATLIIDNGSTPAVFSGELASTATDQRMYVVTQSMPAALHVAGASGPLACRMLGGDLEVPLAALLPGEADMESAPKCETFVMGVDGVMIGPTGSDLDGHLLLWGDVEAESAAKRFLATQRVQEELLILCSSRKLNQSFGHPILQPATPDELPVDVVLVTDLPTGKDRGERAREQIKSIEDWGAQVLAVDVDAD